MTKLFLLGFLLLPGAALASTPGEKPAKPQDGLICRQIEETGSRLGGKRVCLTREQWEASRREARAAVERAQTMQSNPCGGADKC
jgi:hypothetical protein